MLAPPSDPSVCHASHELANAQLPTQQAVRVPICSANHDVRVWRLSKPPPRNSGPCGGGFGTGLAAVHACTRWRQRALSAGQASFRRTDPPADARFFLFPPASHPRAQDIVLEYTTRLLRRAVDSAVARGRVKPGSKANVPVAIGPEDILFLVRKVGKAWSEHAGGDGGGGEGEGGGGGGGTAGGRGLKECLNAQSPAHRLAGRSQVLPCSRAAGDAGGDQKGQIRESGVAAGRAKVHRSPWSRAPRSDPSPAHMPRFPACMQIVDVSPEEMAKLLG